MKVGVATAVETPIALHSVAHRVSQRIPAESEMSRHATTPKSRCRTFHTPDPPPRRQGVEGIAALSLLGSKNGSRYMGD